MSMQSITHFPNEIWDKVRRYTSPFHTGLLAREFNIYPPTEHVHETMWYDIFRDERWLDVVTAQGRNPGLLTPMIRDDTLGQRFRVTILLYR